MTLDNWKRLATQIADGTEVAHGSRVSVFMTDYSALAAVDAFVTEVYRRGGVAQVVATDERFDRAAARFADPQILAQPAPLEVASLDWADVHVSFRGMAVPEAELADPERLALQRRGKGIVSTLRWQKTRWCIVRVPTPEWAKMIDVSFDALLDEFFRGCLADWENKRVEWDALCSRLNGEELVRIVTPDTDLSMSVRGRTWVSFAGEANLPDGEIASAPVDDSAEGFIEFPGRFWFAGTEVKDLRLEFEAGAVVAASAACGEEFVHRLLDTDSGSRRIGELGIGTNSDMQTLTGDLFLDEKILGSVHIALGRAYPQCGGVNESSLHWDLVKDLRVAGSSLSVGGVLLIDDGLIQPALDSPSS